MNDGKLAVSGILKLIYFSAKYNSEEKLYETPLDDALCVEGGVDSNLKWEPMALVLTEPHAV